MNASTLKSIDTQIARILIAVTYPFVALMFIVNSFFVEFWYISIGIGILVYICIRTLIQFKKEILGIYILMGVIVFIISMLLINGASPISHIGLFFYFYILIILCSFFFHEIRLTMGIAVSIILIQLGYAHFIQGLDFFLHIQLILFAILRILFFSSVILIISSQFRRALKESHLREANLHAILDNLFEATIMLNENNTLEYVNPSAELILKCSDNNSWKHTSLDQYISFTSANGTPVKIEDFPTGKNFVDEDVYAKRIDGSTALIRICKIDLEQYKEKSVKLYMLLLLHDITEERTLQDKLHQQDKLHAIGQLAGGIAHDFNNMLTGIMGAANLLQQNDISKEKIQTYAKTILSTSSRAAELVTNLLNFSRQSTANSVAINMCDLVKETVNFLKRTLPQSIEINFISSINAAYVKGDVSLLQNAILNLGINASHAMPQGGLLEIEVSSVFLDDSYCSQYNFQIEAGEFVLISVRDDGIGMDAETIQHIFEPFFTTKKDNKGTGLGLASVYGTVTSHKGAITVYSTKGDGSCFNIYLPQLQTFSTKPKKKSEQLQRGNEHILLVDDEQVILDITSDLLKGLGYTVSTAHNGNECLNYVSKDHSVDLIILDYHMPKTSGIQTLITLREEKISIPVILGSGYITETERSKIDNITSSIFVQKPYRQRGLSKTIRRLLDT